MSLTNAQYESIMREYSRKQSRNISQKEEITKKIYSDYPQLEIINNKISQAALNYTTSSLSGEKSSIDDFKKELNLLKEEKKKLIEQIGITPESFEPDYDCIDCKDTGFIKNKPCHCFKQASIDLIYSQSNIKDILDTENFDNFDLNYYSKDLKNDAGISSYECAQYSLLECKKFCEHFSPEIDNNLMLCGRVGIGKTFLTHCIAKELLDKSYSVLYFTADELCETFQKKTFSKNYSNNYDSFIKNFENIFSSDVLIIDDLGTEFVNSFTSAKLFTCINERMLRGKSTIISTNLSLEEILDIYSERTFSRISQYQIINMFGNDIRLLKKMNNVI